MEGKNGSFIHLASVPGNNIKKILQKLDAITFSRIYRTSKLIRQCAEEHYKSLKFPLNQIMRTTNFEDKVAFRLIKQKRPGRRKSQIVTLRKSNQFKPLKTIFKKYHLHFFHFQEIVMCFNSGEFCLSIHSEKRAIDLANKFAFACYEGNISCRQLRTYYPNFLNSPIRVFLPENLIVHGGILSGASATLRQLKLVAFYNVTIKEALYLLLNVVPYQTRIKLHGREAFSAAVFEKIVRLVQQLSRSNRIEAEFFLEMRTTTTVIYPEVKTLLGNVDYVFIERGVLDFFTTFGLLFLPLPNRGFLFFTGYHDKVACMIILVYKIATDWDDFIDFYCRAYQAIVRVPAKEQELRANPDLLAVKNRFLL